MAMRNDPHFKENKDEAKIKLLKYAYMGPVSQITCWHRPTLGQVKALKDVMGITMIVTIQKKEELPEDIE